MNAGNRVGLTAGLVLGVLAFSAVAAPASAGWWGNDRQWHEDNRWQDNRHDNRHDNRNHDNRYYGYHYREPPVVYGTPYNYGYVAPPVIYDNTPGFTIRIQ